MNFIFIIPTTVVDVVVVEILLFYIRHESRFDGLSFKPFPIEIFEPRVRFHFFASLHSKSLSWLPLQAPVHEVSCVFCVSFRNIFVFDLSLLVQNCIPDLLSASTQVRSSSHYALVSDDSNCKVVSSYTMVLFEHNFRGHVTWGS